jgi:DNA-binding response OmpR family regulator
MHVARLRAKLADSGELLETVRGVGYRFRGPE